MQNKTTINIVIALEKMRELLLRQKELQKHYNISNELIYGLEYDIETNERKFQQMKYLMNDEIAQFPIYGLNPYGKFFRIHWIKSVNDYDHTRYNLHHFIQHQAYVKAPQWYKDNGIEQKLFYISIPLHEQVEYRATKNLSEEEFLRRYKVNRTELIYRRKKDTP